MAPWQRIHLPIQETGIRPLGLKDPLEKKMATHSSIFAWEILQIEDPGQLKSVGSQKRRTLREEIDRTGSVLKAGLHLRPDCGLWAIWPVSMETTYQLENLPWKEEPQGLYLDCLLSGAARTCPGSDKVMGPENFQGSSSPWLCPGGRYVPFFFLSHCWAFY